MSDIKYHDNSPPINPANPITPKMEKKAKSPYYDIILLLLPLFAGGFVFWAMINLNIENGFVDILKAFMVGTVAGLVSYAVNRFGIDWGANLASAGSMTAGIFSVVSIVSVGALLWFFSFSGIILPDVRILRLEEHGQHLVQYVDTKNALATQAKRIVPPLRAASSEFNAKAQCEIKSGCVSLRGGGAGTISSLLEEKATRAGGIADQFDEGVKLQATTRAQINKLIEKYQTVLSDDGKSTKLRRRELIKIDAEIGQAVATLDEAIPVTLISAYASELNGGVTISGRPGATGRMNDLLRKHGVALQSIIGSLEAQQVTRSVFPAKAGLGDTLTYIGNFAGIAGIIAVAECVFPIALWLYTLLFLIQQREEEEKRAARSRPTYPHGSGANGNGTQERSRKRPRGPKETPRHLNGGGDHVE